MPLDSDRARLMRIYQVRISAYVLIIIVLAVAAVAAPPWPLRIVLGLVALVALLPLAANIRTYRRLASGEPDHRQPP